MPSMLEQQAARHGGSLFARLPDGDLSYSEANARADRFAAWLWRRGLGDGEIVACHAGTSVATLVVWFGCRKAGVVFLPIHPLLSGDPLQRLLESAQPAVVVVDARRLEQVEAGLPLEGRSEILVVEPGWDLSEQVTSRSRVGGSDAGFLDPAGPAKVLYTSGTTGEAKGVLWSRRCEDVWAAAYADELIGIGPGEGVYCCLPLSHVTCQGTVAATLWRGGHITLDERFDPFGFWDRIRASEARVFTFVGTLLDTLARRPRRPDDRDNPVRRIMGAATPAWAWEQIAERFGVEIVETWGQTETAACWMAPSRLPGSVGTVGRPGPRFEARLADAAGGPTPGGAVGELWMRPRDPKTMFDRYLGEARSAAWTEDGWYRTGDLFLRDPAGDYVFRGRLREVIRRRGETLSPITIEECAMSSPAIAEAAAVGVPDPAGIDEEILLCVVPEPGTTFDLAQLLAHLRRHLPRYMVPRYVRVLDELPKTPSTRVRRYQLQRDGLAGTLDTRRSRAAPRPGDER